MTSLIDLPSAGQQKFSTIKANTLYAGIKVQFLQDYSKISTKTFIPNLSSVSVKQIVKNVIRTLRKGTLLYGVKFTVQISNKLNANVKGDHGRMHRVLFSILQNAAFEARAGSTIDIKLQTKPLALDERQQEKVDSAVDILDFTMLIMCSVCYEHHA